MRIAVIGFHSGQAETMPEHVRVGRMVMTHLARRSELTLAIWPPVPVGLDWTASFRAEKCNTHGAAARGADMVLVAMDSVANLRGVLFGVGQAISELAKPGATILDMSCLSTDEMDYTTIPGEIRGCGKHYVAVTLEPWDALPSSAKAIRLRLSGPYNAIQRAMPVLELATMQLFTDA